ncbi:LamB/YcsF family protein [Falsibacillus albus]|uniref:5-oxoprolinase subunit A n=1 Tax=Falsibacillus albus TaxID=2478915 RepID=A0A3L7JZ32_9BACI|nr:5-oxoprolinase subunit PxpA [Falsibacillus albus]RLQ95389.1 LamB/YcsF family protein [Falsibacillus albus]
MTKKIDLNCDIGESFGQYKQGNDRDIMPHVTSANIACGFHAGDPNVMAETIALAVENKVAIGAHPGLPDLVGFGRRKMEITPEDAYCITTYQIGALEAFLRRYGRRLHHVKPHGALYNMSAVHRTLAEAIVKAVHDFDSSLILYGLSGSELTHSAEKIGLQVGYEIFADRTYQHDGTLTPRNHPRAMITDINQCIEQSMEIMTHQRVKTVDGSVIPLKGNTICLHSDGNHALSFSKMLKDTFQSQGFEVAAL